uniref:Uncharacterized protein n=1 Tax=Opuntia streptacantha TaxID=393608 RepID=A0A7C9A5K4_OPUST
MNNYRNQGHKLAETKSVTRSLRLNLDLQQKHIYTGLNLFLGQLDKILKVVDQVIDISILKFFVQQNRSPFSMVCSDHFPHLTFPIHNCHNCIADPFLGE